MTQLTLEGISAVSNNGKLEHKRESLMPTNCPPATLADLSQKPLRFSASFTMRLDGDTLRAVESLAASLGSTRGAVARRLLHLGLTQVLLEDTNAASQG